uniref:Coiled-coil domain-containing protein 177-like n=1 Tax=Phallusia mammillata TaxID=59560 RepID=A0A6F9D7Y3_9ASCI|nr:coiled-coil domain-containing protein 177-like [Phallusia mammillata]
MDQVLHLYNFDIPEAEGSRYVLTSPRSLEACSRLHIKPVQLLPKPFSEFVAENAGKSTEFVQIMFNDWEEKRVQKLKRCRHEREKIIMEHQVASTKASKNKSKNENRNPNSLNKPKPLSRISPEKSMQSPRQPKKKATTQSVFVNNSNNVMKTCKPPIIQTESPSRERTPETTELLHASSLSSNNYHQIGFESPESERSRSMDLNKLNRSRSKSVETQKRSSKFSTQSLRSSAMGFSSQLPSGYVTPQIERDKRLVVFMKEKRKRQEMEEKERRNKILQWSEEKQKHDEAKRKEEHLRQKELAASKVHWQTIVKKSEEKRITQQKEQEVKLLHQQEMIETTIKVNKEKQEKQRLRKLEERKKAVQERKHQQEKMLECVQKEVEAFQEATNQDIRGRLEKAEKIKLEAEMRELEKVKMMNRSQWERFREVQKLVRSKREEEERIKKQVIEEKIHRAEENHLKQILERNNTLKNQCHEIQEKIRQTKENQKRLDRQTEEHLYTIAEHKADLIKQAETTALKNTQNRSKRAQKMRISSEQSWKRNLSIIREKDQELVQKTMEDLEAKENQAKKHLQLKEAALEFSRVQAKINEAEREIVKRKSSNFNEMAQKAKLAANIGRGPRSSFVNYSTVKLG